MHLEDLLKIILNLNNADRHLFVFASSKLKQEKLQ